MRVILFAAVAAGFALEIAAIAWVAVAVSREQAPTREELERAEMRSMSWPSKD